MDIYADCGIIVLSRGDKKKRYSMETLIFWIGGVTLVTIIGTAIMVFCEKISKFL
jgi:hypothetical protein